MHREQKVMTLALIVLSVSIMFVACGEQEIDVNVEGDYFEVFFASTENEGLVSVNIDYQPEKNVDDIQYLINYLKKDMDHSVEQTVPDTLGVERVTVLNNGIKVYFDEQYELLMPLEEVRVRSSIVKTLTGIEGVKDVEFFVNNQSIIDKSGKKIGAMTTDDVMIEIGDFNPCGTKRIRLFLSDGESDKLVPVYEVIDVYKDEKLEKTVVNYLIKGLPDSGYNSLLPSETVVRSVNVYQGVCYVDFNEAFITKHKGGSNNELLTIYSIVNTLTELPDINKVQFFVEGELRETLKGHMRFDGIFERNLNVVKY